MARRVRVFLLLIAFVGALFATTLASGGTSADPLVSKSYVDGAFLNSVISNATAKVASAISTLKTRYIEKVNNAIKIPSNGEIMLSGAADAALASFQKKGQYPYSTPKPVSEKAVFCDTFSAKNGTMIMITSGKAKCASGSLINIVRGTEIGAGNALPLFTTLMFPEGGATIEIISGDATVLVDGPCTHRTYVVKYQNEANALKILGLVKGAANGLELQRKNTRAESITLLIRLLGEEGMALSAEYSHPFTDVEAWAKRYVGYAYHMGYTKGVSSTMFGASKPTTAEQYVTFILRALGYSEEAGDFKYQTVLSDAVRLGVFDEKLVALLRSEELRRDHVMYISYRALAAKVKGSNTTLLARLVANGAVDGESANAFLK